MEKLDINSFDMLIKAADYMHDSGFKKENIEYDTARGIFKITTKEYEYKGRFIKKQTSAIKGECKLLLFNVQKCDIVERDKLGYQSVGEDYFNTFKIKNEKTIVIKTTFHEIKIEIEKLEGEFEYCEN